MDEAQLLTEWRQRATRALFGHYESARRFERRARVLAMVSLTVSLAAAALTAFVLASRAPGTEIRLLAAITASLATLLGLLGTQLDLRVRAAEHRGAGAGYSKVRRLLEAFAADAERDLESAEFRHIQQLYSDVSRGAPIIPKGPLRDAERRYGEREGDKAGTLDRAPG